MSFANLRNNKANALSSLQQKVQAAAAGEGGGNKDPRKWKVTYDKSTKVGSAVIRFLPFGGGDRLPWAEWIEFSFKGKGGNYWERSLKSIGKDDPVAELNHLQWQRGEANGGQEGPDCTAVKKRGRRLRYLSNIVVVSDPAHPENNGKVFLFEYGPAIHKKIMSQMVPEYADQAQVPVFDMWEGATFRVRTKDKSGYLNYDDSIFDSPSVLHQDDAVLETFYNGMHDLVEFEAETNYKTFDALEVQMKKVLGEAYVAGIKGEQFDASQGGAGNPFAAQQQQGGQQQQAQPQQSVHTNMLDQDPFAASSDAASSGDPFAGQQQGGQQQSQPQAQQASADPFAGQQQGGQQQSQPQAQQASADPFAGATGNSNADDPFADLDL